MIAMADNHGLSVQSSTPSQEAADVGGVDLRIVFPSGLPRNPSHNPEYSDDVEAALEMQHVHDDMLASRSELEKKVLMPISDPTLVPVAANIREAALRFMSHLTQLMNLPPNTWFQTVTLFDIYCLSMPEGPLIEQLPATCIALVKLLQKMDCAAASPTQADLSPLGDYMGEWLETLGHLVQPTTNRTIANVELSLLQVLNWQLDMPTVESWMSMFCARINILTQSAFIASFNWIWEQSICYARMILIKQALSPTHPPIQMATGLIALGCVSARLIPVATIRPLKVCARTWDQSFAESQPGGTIPECVLTEAQSQQVLQLLHVSTRANLEEIQDACRVLVPCMKEAYVSILQMHGHSSSPVYHSVI